MSNSCRAVGGVESDCTEVMLGLDMYSELKEKPEARTVRLLRGRRDCGSKRVAESNPAAGSFQSNVRQFAIGQLRISLHGGH
jgi:hypothetical protein